MTGAAAVDAAADLFYALDPLDWVVIVAALVSLIVLVRELRRGPTAPITPED